MATEELHVRPTTPAASLLARKLSLARWRSSASSFADEHPDALAAALDDAAASLSTDYASFVTVSPRLRRGAAAKGVRFWDSAAALASPAAAVAAAGAAAVAAVASARSTLGPRTVLSLPPADLVGEGDALADPGVWAGALVAARAPGDDAVWPQTLAAVAGATMDRADLAPDQADALADVESVFEVAAFVAHWAKGGHTVEIGRL